MIILGIDPGYDRIGVSIVEKTKKDGEQILFSDCINTNKQDDFPDRLKQLGEELDSLIKKWKPKKLAIEKLFFHKNQKTAGGVFEARGVIIYICALNGLGVHEFTPLEIKTTIAGYGRADKKQVQEMVFKLVKINKKIFYDDEIDAIAVALTCLARNRF